MTNKVTALSETRSIFVHLITGNMGLNLIFLCSSCPVYAAAVRRLNTHSNTPTACL
jgi:hypothetical protein